MPIHALLKRQVRERANHYCEYCRIHQDQLPFATFHIEHVVARQHEGSDEFSNLALSCHWCNFNKGTNLTTMVDGVLVSLFNPRTQNWNDHFVLHEELILGITTTGRGTVRLLDMNDDERQQIRRVS